MARKSYNEQKSKSAKARKKVKRKYMEVKRKALAQELQMLK